MVQYSQINTRNTSHKQKERQKSHDHINRCRKSIWEGTVPIYNKNTQQSGSRGSIPQHIKAIYEKLTPNIILRLGTRWGCLLSPLLFNIVLEVSHSNLTRKEIKGIQTGKQEVKVSLFADDI